MLFSSDGELVAGFVASGLIAVVGGVGDTDIGRLVGELDDGRGRGLLLKLRGPPEFDPGVTASNADPSPEGKLYGENR